MERLTELRLVKDRELQKDRARVSRDERMTSGILAQTMIWAVLNFSDDARRRTLLSSHTLVLDTGPGTAGWACKRGRAVLFGFVKQT